MDFLRLSLVRTTQIMRPGVVICKTCVPKQNRQIPRRFVSLQFHTSACWRGLEEFFDTVADIEKDKNLNVGRPWRLDELRIKSSEDLHKLWYVLLKERNMLLTMEELYVKREQEFPRPERIDKVEESMENILEVVKERDTAYNVLETGKTGEQEKYEIRNFLGIPYQRTPVEHYVPQHKNAKFNMMHPKYSRWMERYLLRYDEKLRSHDNFEEKRVEKLREKLMDEFPNLTDEDAEKIQPKKKYKN